MILVKKLLDAIESVYEDLHQAEIEQKLIKKELRSLRKEKIQNSKLIKQCGNEQELVILEKDRDSLDTRRATWTEYLIDVEAKIDRLRTKICEKCDMLFNTLEANIYPFEMLKTIERRTGRSWNVRWIKSWNGVNVGVAFVREDDENFDKTIYADTSLIDMSVDIENTDSRKVVFTDMVLPVESVYVNWNWLEYYVYSKTGFFFNEVMQQHFDAFNERDPDFAEFVISEIREEIDRETIDDFIKEKNTSNPENE